MFWFKKKKIVVDAFAPPTIVKYTPIVRYSKSIPEWFRSLPSEYNTYENDLEIPMPTMKRCTGVVDLYKNSFTIPLWSDLIIKTYEQGGYSWKWSNGIVQDPVGNSSPEQHNNSIDHMHLKLHSPWKLRESTGINFYWAESFWSLIDVMDSVHVPPAIVNYKHQHSTEINMFFSRQDRQYTFSAGQPLVTLVPMTEHDVEIRCHYDEDEYNKLSTIELSRPKFGGNYNFKKRCPYGNNDN